MSLRARLTLSYAVFAALVLIVVTVALLFFTVFLSTRSISDNVNATVAHAQAILAADRGKPEASVQGDLRAMTVPSGVTVRVNPKRIPPPGFFRDGDRRAPSAPGDRPRRRRFDPGPFSAFVPPPRLFDTGPEGDVFIAPDLSQLRAIVTNVEVGFLGALVLTVLASWLLGRWITARAVAPLDALIAELRRFAGGDFTPRVITANDRSEIGELVDAYNGAAAQVANALNERARVEAHMRTYLGEAGHEMRTPLTVISGYLDLLSAGGWDDPALRERALPALVTETRRLRTLVERVMTLARLERDAPSEAEPVDIAASAADAIREVTAARGGLVRLNVNGTPVVFAEPLEVREAIGNLVDNAVKYGGGTPVTVDAAEDGDTVTVRVTDNGPGIPAAERERLFERFFRGEAAADIAGSGLGLAIVARAAARSGGRVELDAPGPNGTTFRLSFPSYRDALRARQRAR